MRSAAGVTTDSTGVSGSVRIVTPAGTTMSRTRIMSPSSSSVTSASICSGTSPGRHSISTSRRWCSSTPPVFTPGRLADLVDLDRHLHLLVAANLEEVDVDVPAVEVIALHLARDRHVHRPVDLEVDDHRRAVRLPEEVLQLLAGQGDRHRLDPVAVEHAGDEPLGTQLAGGTLAASVACLGFENGFHGRSNLALGGGTRDSSGRVWGAPRRTRRHRYLSAPRCVKEDNDGNGRHGRRREDCDRGATRGWPTSTSGTCPRGSASRTC